jgi:hypothetical protein
MHHLLVLASGAIYAHGFVSPHPTALLNTARYASLSTSSGRFNYIPASDSTSSFTAPRNDLVAQNAQGVNTDMTFSKMSNQEFTMYIKTLASKRKLITKDIKSDIIQNFFRISSSLANDEIYDCIWGIGTLGIKAEDMTSLQIELLMNSIDTKSGSAKQLLKCFSGLSKIGIRWSSIDASMQADFLTTFITSQSTVVEDKARAISETSKGALFDAREVATFVYTLGQIGCSKESLDPSQTETLFSLVASVLDSSTAQGIANIFHGISKMDFTWSDIPSRIQQALFDACTTLMPSLMIGIELSSILNSMALMKARFEEFPTTFRESVLLSLLKTAGTYNARQISNAIWCLGKLHAEYRGFGTELIVEFERVLVREANRLQPFDVESLLVGFGLMQVHYAIRIAK